MGFVEFDRPRRAGSSDPMATLTKQQTIRLNKAFAERYLPNASHVVLLFNEDTNQIALRPSDGTERHAYRLREQGAQKEISGNAFIRHFRIKQVTESQQFTPQFDDQLGAVILTEPVKTE